MPTTEEPTVPEALAAPDAIHGAPQSPAGRRVRGTAVALVAASLPMFMATLDNLVMTTALPVIRTSLSASLEQLQWMVNAYTLAFASLMIAAATLGDRIGRRRMFVLGIVVFTLASAGSALATTAPMLIATRALQGVGAAAIMPLSLTLLAGAVPAAKRALAIGVWGGVSGLGVALGPVIGGAIVDGISWQAIFWINVPVGIVAVPLIRAVLPESHGRAQRLDVPGLALAAGGVLALVWAIVRGNDAGWGSAEVVSGLVAGVGLLAGFVWRELLTDHPLVPLRMFRVRSFSVATSTAFLFSVGVFGIVFLLAQFFQVAMGYSPLQAGIRTLPWTAAPMIVAPIAGMIAPRVGVRPLLVAGLALQAVGLAWQGVLVSSTGLVYADLVPGLILCGVGMGLTFAPSSTAVLADMVPNDHGTASSVNATVREIGGALGIAVLVAVFQAAHGALTPQAYATGLRPAVLWAAAIVGVGALLALLMPRVTGRAGAPSERTETAEELAAASELEPAL
jgi:EmrB/QacA subfamily drug resistance transporter